MGRTGKLGNNKIHIETRKKDPSCIVTQIDRLTQHIKTKYPGVILQTRLDESNNLLNLIMLHVPENMRRRGIARYVLRCFCRLADQLQFNMVLQPSSAFGIPLNVLIALYLQYGFHIQTVDCMHRQHS